MLGDKYFNKVAGRYARAQESAYAKFWLDYDLSIIRQNLPEKRAMFIDIGCGVGTYSVHLAPLFERTILVDISHLMLRQAEKNLRTISPPCKTKFLHADIRRIDINRLGGVSFILALGGALCYQHDTLGIVIRKVSNTLMPGGCFVFDVWNRHGFFTGAQQYSAPRRSFNTLDLNNAMRYLRNGRTSEQSLDSKICVWTYKPKQVLEMMRTVGLRVISCYGRKATELVLRKEAIKAAILQNRNRLLALEHLLSQEDEIVPICPKVIFLATKEIK